METKFNFNSQICTTREQSGHLLALGLKKETADMTIHVKNDGHWYITAEPFYEWEDDFNTIPCLEEPDAIIPAWSLHRLIEMMPENVTSDDWLGISFDDVSYYHGEGEGIIGWMFYKSGNLYDCIVDAYEWLIKEGYFNKKYLV